MYLDSFNIIIVIFMCLKAASSVPLLLRQLQICWRMHFFFALRLDAHSMI